MHRLQRILSRAWLFGVALAVALCVAPTLAQAADRTVNLVAQGGSVGQASVTLGEGDTLPTNLPTPTKTGWTFIGWYTAPVEYMFWDDPEGLWRPISVPAGFTNDPKDGQLYTYDPDYWSWLTKTSGTRVNAGGVVPAGVDTLYACFDPTTVTIRFHWNGWQAKFGVLYAHKDYDSTGTGVGVSDWAGHAFTGWYTSRLDGQGSVYTGNDNLTHDLDVYAHYTGMAPDPEAQRSAMIPARSIKVTPKTSTIDPDGGKVNLSATLEMLSSTDVPTGTHWSNVTWTITQGAGLATLSTTHGSSCTVTATNHGSGTVRVQASFLNESAKTVTSTVEVNVKAHEHSYGAETVIVQPTCQRDGYGTRVCKGCGDIQRIEHKRVDHTCKTDRHAPTCTDAGYERKVCTVCGTVVSTVTIPAKGHSYGPVEVIQSCTGRTEVRTCKNCPAQETKSTGTGQHTWERDYTVDEPATCGTAGSKSIHCSKCSVTKDSVTIPATEKHTFGGWHTTKPATTTAKGVQERECVTCHKVETQELPVLVGEPADPTPEVPDPEPQVPDTPDTPDTPDAPDASEPGQQPAEPVIEKTSYHLVNPYNGEHLYTTDHNEYVTNVARGWQDKGDAKVPETSSQPVYRLYNPYSHEHHYTMDLNEYRTLDAAGWDGEGVKFYSDESQGVPVHRYWKGVDGEGTHVYVENPADISYYESIGWKDEGISWYYLA